MGPLWGGSYRGIPALLGIVPILGIGPMGMVPHWRIVLPSRIVLMRMVLKVWVLCPCEVGLILLMGPVILVLIPVLVGLIKDPTVLVGSSICCPLLDVGIIERL